MRRGIAADAPLSDAGEERLSEEDRRALKMIEELFPGEYRAAKREVAAAIASDAPSSLGGLAAILSQRGNPDGAVLAGRIVEARVIGKKVCPEPNRNPCDKGRLHAGHSIAQQCPSAPPLHLFR